MRSKLDECKTRLKEEMENSLSILRWVNDNKPDHRIVNSIYEISFLKMYLTWEWFLERTFIFYLMGEKTDRGYCPRSYFNPRDEHHAYAIIKGNARYPNWLDLDFIRDKAELFFENGSPFKESLCDKDNIRIALSQMRKIRNNIVHISPRAKEEYESLIRNEFGILQNLSPGEFLGKIKDEENKVSYITYYKNILETASDEIVK
ncbi:MAG: hypothetical protein ABIK73_00555 [candidate division WOR-3 bacterium]